MKNSLPVTLLLLFSFFSSFSQVKLDSGLVAYYPFNGNANDLSGNNNNPVFNNASLTADSKGNANSAYHFDGSSTYMMVPNNPTLNFNNQMSISLKVRPMDFYTGPCYNNMLLMKGDADYVPGTYFLRFSDVVTGCTVPTTTDEQFYGSGVIATNPIVQLNKWYNVTWTYNGVTAKIYIDCVLMGSHDSAFAPFTSNFDLYIGKLNNAQYPYWLNGDLDDIRIYNRALNDQEINALCPSGALPVTLTKFDAVVQGQQVRVNWNVENENEILNYTVERSLTGHSDFTSLKKITPGNAKSYSFTDNTTNLNQNYYYRLAITGTDGQISYSQVKAIKVTGKNKVLVVYSNPSTATIKFKLNGFRGNAGFTIVNAMGQAILRKSQLITDNSLISLETHIQSKGVYWLKVETNGEESSERIMVF